MDEPELAVFAAYNRLIDYHRQQAGRLELERDLTLLRLAEKVGRDGRAGEFIPDPTLPAKRTARRLMQNVLRLSHKLSRAFRTREAQGPQRSDERG